MTSSKVPPTTEVVKEGEKGLSDRGEKVFRNLVRVYKRVLPQIRLLLDVGC